MFVIETNDVPIDGLNETCDVCIVGAGAAGLYLATKLTRAGHSVVILEAGNHTPRADVDLGLEASIETTEYRGSSHGRFFGLGGSTTRWGGLVMSHSEFDRRPLCKATLDAWDCILDTVTAQQNSVAKQLGLDSPRKYENVASRFVTTAENQLAKNGLVVRAAEFLPFKKKNLAFLLDDVKHHKGNLKIFLNAVTCKWNLATKGTLTTATELIATAENRPIRVQANTFVLAAGAIESTRMLLELRRKCPLVGSDSLGKKLSDHLSSTVGFVPRSDALNCIRLFGPRFLHGRMRSFRFLRKDVTSTSLPRFFAHFIFDSDQPGFRLAKKIMGNVQSRQSQSISVSDLLYGTTGLFRIGADRLLRNRLHISARTPIRLQLDVEQEPDTANQIQLTDELDRYGRPKAKIHWSIQPSDYANIDSISKWLIEAWDDKGGLPRVTALDHSSVESSKPHDAYHPVGTCAIGVSQDAVVQKDLKVNGTSNLFVLSTAVFPTAGTANPTFSMLCLGEELSHYLAKRLKQQHVAIVG